MRPDSFGCRAFFVSGVVRRFCFPIIVGRTIRSGTRLAVGGGETTAACEMIRVFLLKGRIVGRRPRLCESVEAVFSVESIAFGPDEDAETLS